MFFFFNLVMFNLNVMTRSLGETNTSLWGILFINGDVKCLEKDL